MRNYPASAHWLFRCEQTGGRKIPLYVRIGRYTSATVNLTGFSDRKASKRPMRRSKLLKLMRVIALTALFPLFALNSGMATDVPLQEPSSEPVLTVSGEIEQKEKEDVVVDRDGDVRRIGDASHR